jgi:hypothetical protein
VADLTVEQFGQLPDFVKDDYEKSGEVYRPKAEGKVATLKASLDALDVKHKTTDAQLREILAKSEDDRTKAEQAAFERLKKEGKVDELIADYERRMGETKKQYEDRIEKMTAAAKNDKRSAIVSELVSELATEKGKKAFARLVEGRIDYDPETGKTIFLNEDGSASSLDLAGFKAEIEKSDLFESLVKAQVNRGGDARGSNDRGGASKTMKRSDFEALNPVQRAKFMKEGGNLTN